MAEEKVVVLVHGIRDFALWQSAIRDTLEASGFSVAQVNYGRFNLIRFLLPFPVFRASAIKKVEQQLRIVKSQYQNAEISIIAHSFGTHVIASILKDGFDLKFHKIIFCGSVLPYEFPFEQISTRFDGQIINEVGAKDIWPAIAESVTFGYGSAGTYGFRRPLVRDRWHDNAKHGFFLTASFCRKFWIPFLLDNKIVNGSRAPNPPSFGIRLLTVFKLKYLFSLGVFGVCAYAIMLSQLQKKMQIFPDSLDVVADARFGLYCNEQQVSAQSFSYFDYVTVNRVDCPKSEMDGSRSLLVDYETFASDVGVAEQKQGYSICFDSDFFTLAPKIDSEFDRVFSEPFARNSCFLSSFVTRIIRMDYIDNNNVSRTLNFAQDFDLGSSKDTRIQQIPSTNAATPEGLDAVRFDRNFKLNDMEFWNWMQRYGFAEDSGN